LPSSSGYLQGASITDLLLFFVPQISPTVGAATDQCIGIGAQLHFCWPWYWFRDWSGGAALPRQETDRIDGQRAAARALAHKIYGAVKQVNEAFTSGKKTAFKTVVLVEFPREGMYSSASSPASSTRKWQMKTKEKSFVSSCPHAQPHVRIPRPGARGKGHEA